MSRKKKILTIAVETCCGGGGCGSGGGDGSGGGGGSGRGSRDVFIKCDPVKMTITSSDVNNLTQDKDLTVYPWFNPKSGRTVVIHSLRCRTTIPDWHDLPCSQKNIIWKRIRDLVHDVIHKSVDEKNFSRIESRKFPSTTTTTTNKKKKTTTTTTTNEKSTTTTTTTRNNETRTTSSIKKQKTEVKPQASSSFFSSLVSLPRQIFSLLSSPFSSRVSNDQSNAREGCPNGAALMETALRSASIGHGGGDQQRRNNNNNNNNCDVDVDEFAVGTKRKLDEDDCDEESCIICFYKFGGGDDLKKLWCGHEFHSNCLKNWLDKKGSCPVCLRCVLCRSEENFEVYQM